MASTATTRRAPRPVARVTAAVASGGCLLLLLAGCSAEPVQVPDAGRPSPTGQPAGESLGLPGDPDVLLEVGDSADQIRQRGSAPVAIAVVSLDGGALDVREGRSGGMALRFPPFVARPGAEYPRAVVQVTNSGPADRLSPGERDFTWGADFKLDAASFGRPDDNGDNLVQRGLASHPTQFKAELDGDRAACTATGDAGTLIVRASERVRPGRWYRLRCQRRGDELAVFVTQFGPEGPARTYASHVRGPVGDITMSTPDTPLTVGGKIGADGEVLADASDQFNGLVMNPVLAIG